MRRCVLAGLLFLVLLAGPMARAGEADTQETGTDAREASTPARHPKDGFTFGTYGRVQASSNLDGRPGKSANVVSHGPRLMEGPYLELDFGYAVHTDDDFGVRVLATLAFFEELFHFDSEMLNAIAIRNLYAEAENFIPDVDLKLWVGSRMYRGDDIYLLDFWPLDNLNTLGGGLSWQGYGFVLKGHAGVNRLRNDYQLRTLSVPQLFGADEITIMERLKLISSLKAEYHLLNIVREFSMKFVLYGEFHHLPRGEFTYSKEDAEYLERFALKVTPGLDVEMPADRGGVFGAQLGMWGFGNGSHLNLFARFAFDLAAYGEWGVPWGLAADKTTKGARDYMLATSFNWESHWVGVMVGGYGRYFEDADVNGVDLDDFWEGALSVRPAIFATRHVHMLFELSHQWKVPKGLGPGRDEHLLPQVWQMSVFPTLSMDRGMYRRPQFRLVYTASHLNDAARNLFPSWDARRDAAWQHYLGVQVEWWLNSSSYQ